jgi:putative hydrolase of the HAD superfamily
LYVFSNSNSAHEISWSGRYAGLLSHFRQIFVSSTIGLRKPDAAAFQAVAAAIGVPAGRMVFFDDNAENVTGAQNCGLPAFRVISSADVAAVFAHIGL